MRAFPVFLAGLAILGSGVVSQAKGLGDAPPPGPGGQQNDAKQVPPDLWKVPRRLVKEYYWVAYAKYAPCAEWDKDTKDTCKTRVTGFDTNNLKKNAPFDCRREDDDPRKLLTSGWPASPCTMPVFLTEDEAAVTPNWQDYNRINASATFIPAGSGTTRSFILVQSKVFRTAYFSYSPAADDQSYDLTKPPILRRLTRAQEERYWSDLPYYSQYVTRTDEKRFSAVLGISPDGFQLGGTTAQTTDATKATYLLGFSYSLNPYASLHVGAATNNGRNFHPAFGFGLDIDIISKIFGGAK